MTQDETTQDGAGLSHSAMDERNLERALLDFELANARVLDLTQRLVGLTNELVNARQQLEEVKLRLSRVEAEYQRVAAENAQIKASLAYRGFRFLGDARARIRK